MIVQGNGYMRRNLWAPTPPLCRDLREILAGVYCRGLKTTLMLRKVTAIISDIVSAWGPHFFPQKKGEKTSGGQGGEGAFFFSFGGGKNKKKNSTEYAESHQTARKGLASWDVVNRLAPAAAG